eukprot:CAMPEP_0174263864 /NCGR_PEP_ID=MMETSP0439-20130205/20430_1 /TAXON_ID=0 /ORGANISM="Stereomyxa ramosa, Strain Chinc5" /LENGTH=223 /DNA_ID=CAMNT_0015349475 /DNA_START=28 /DNA_END=696 /DNA_ORIENTATION=-
MDNYAELANNAFEKAKHFKDVDLNEWTVEKDSNGSIMYSLENKEDSPFAVYRVEAEIPDKTPSELVDRLWEFEEEEWQQLDSAVKTFEKVEELDFTERAKVVYQVNKVPFPLWNRDTVALWTVFNEDPAYYCVATSCTHPDKPEYPKQYVRNTLVIGMFCFEPSEEGGTKATRIIQIDPQGNIPVSLVSLTATKIHAVLERLANVTESRGIRGSKQYEKNTSD